MRVVITGGTGFIGRALAARLAAEGHEVLVPTRSLARAARSLGAAARPLAWDGTDPGPLAKALDGAEGPAAVVNLAGEGIASGRWTLERKSRIVHSRVRAAQAVVEAVAMARRTPEVVVQGSAVGYYGPRASAGGEVLGEDASKGHGFLAEVCQRWEAAVAPAADSGARVCVARTGLVIGFGGGVLEKFAGPFRAFMGGPLGDGGQWLPWVHMADEAGALAWMLENRTARGVYNLCAPQAVTMRVFCSALGRALGRPSWLRVPAAALRLALGREMADETVLASQRAAPTRLLEEGYSFAMPGLGAALREALAPRPGAGARQAEGNHA